MLELKDINLDFRHFSLRNVHLEIKDQEYHILLGPSGSGKTLLMDIIAGFRNIDSGKVIYRGEDITHKAPQKRNIAYLFQDLALFPHLSVFENVAFPLRLKHVGGKQWMDQVGEYLDFTGVGHLAQRQIGKLSGGEKQRVALARMLITESKMLLLDEPFSALDTELKLDLKKLLKKIAALGVSILHITHNFEEAISLADSLTVIENGKIISSAPFLGGTSLLNHKFTAGLSGERNYFFIKKVVSEGDALTLMISSDKGASTIFPIIFSGLMPDHPQSAFIPTNQILLSPKHLISSARNSFEATVTSIFRTENGYELELSPLEAGSHLGDLHFWVKITKQSFDSLQISLDQTLWISFKASAVQVF